MPNQLKLAFRGYNALAVASAERLSELPRAATNVGVVALVGTQRRCRL